MEKSEIETKLSRGTKNIELCTGENLYFWYANNRGRGSNNVTIIRVAPGYPRANVSAKQAGVISTVRTSGWKGQVNYSAAVHNALFSDIERA